MPKRNRRTEEVCHCEQWDFPHRRNRDCEDREAAEAGEAADEAAYQQAMWDKDRADAVRN
jgi:hypothetical protein